VETKQLQKIHDRLRVIQVAYSRVPLQAVLDCKIFLEILEKNIILSEVPNVSDVAVEGATMYLEWSNISKQGKLDMFTITFIGNGWITYESWLDTIQTTIKKVVEIKEELDEILMIHIKHFNS
jgi:hypothetical protein